MNIFVTSPCPIESAKFLDNKRKVKMALESTQMLATALNVNGVVTPYRTAHVNHPCSIWVRQSQQNWQWLFLHGIALCNEYTRIYKKEHACLKVLKQMLGQETCLPDTGLTPFPNCARSKEKGLDYSMEPDVHLAYKLYLADRWAADKRTPEWS